MRNRYLVTVGVTAAAALGAFGCNNDKITNLNRNPNNPLTAPSGPVFTQAVRLSVSRWLGNAYDLRGTEFVAQHLAESQYPDEDAYTRLQGSATTGTFDGAYAGELEDFQQVIKGGQAQNAPRIWAPALIMRTWVFGYLTDTWGDIP